MNKLFSEPEMKVTKFEYEDIMTNSGVGDNDQDVDMGEDLG